ncbi:hypothetical protein VFPFJ_04993 [Purpureocillium lilacinum]|uniref:Uncharacterized protein n=1 Tax=Purpureocillium lilacinum TaxID=33203 RepID=A0A179H1D1_PURLI|nr:hypothetical protein VFPFJ_04993 [Purpureocillium lilacinum]OAQ84045.1 hypothetical protein VFPBJ_02813 [Purpureocillium lilacinum]OAQ90834.1 hypothetical protein VFPFJ_04993 [Purpureocillium lilacinum]
MLETGLLASYVPLGGGSRPVVVRSAFSGAPRRLISRCRSIGAAWPLLQTFGGTASGANIA